MYILFLLRIRELMQYQRFDVNFSLHNQAYRKLETNIYSITIHCVDSTLMIPKIPQAAYFRIRLSGVR